MENRQIDDLVSETEKLHKSLEAILEKLKHLKETLNVSKCNNCLLSPCYSDPETCIRSEGDNVDLW